MTDALDNEAGPAKADRRATVPEAQRALVAILLTTPAPSLGVWVWFWLAPGTAIGFIAYALGKVWLYGLPLVWHRVVDRERFSVSPPHRGGFLVGAGAGLVISTVIWLVYLFYAESRIDAESIRDLITRNGLADPLRYILAGVYVATLNALLEEYVFRWFIVRQCERAMPGGAAVIVAAFIFTLHHVIVLKAYFGWDITLLGTAGVFAGGVIWSAMYHHYRSIWPCWLSHAIVDVAIFALGWRIMGG